MVSSCYEAQPCRCGRISNNLHLNTNAFLSSSIFPLHTMTTRVLREGSTICLCLEINNLKWTVCSGHWGKHILRSCPFIKVIFTSRQSTWAYWRWQQKKEEDAQMKQSVTVKKTTFPSATRSIMGCPSLRNACSCRCTIIAVRCVLASWSAKGKNKIKAFYFTPWR